MDREELYPGYFRFVLPRAESADERRQMAEKFQQVAEKFQQVFDAPRESLPEIVLQPRQSVAASAPAPLLGMRP